MQALNVMREISQVAGYLDAELACRTQDKELGILAIYISTLDHGNAVSGRLACPGLRQSHDIAAALLQKIRDDRLLNRHRVFKT